MTARRIACSWDDFRRRLRDRDGRPIEPIYRGQARISWSLVPPSKRLTLASIEQHDALAEKNEIFRVRREFDSAAYDGQWKHFRHLATGLPGASLVGMGDDEVQALARHHGLCTNLLDWTISPYVAAFFAYASALDIANEGRLFAGVISYAPIYPPRENIAVWRLGVSEGLWVAGEFDCLNNLSAGNLHQKAQSGLFTRLRHRDIADLETYLEQRGMSDHLEVFEIAASDALGALADLKDMNITFATLFPDLRGAAMHANFASILELY